ncbi:hypothetical protein BKA82DRAFT_4009347 [Pisolithus tinctorius]|nr:hypothetical protein BKA82DRAFT_4009347 [Pisolithus tinctorius]
MQSTSKASTLSSLTSVPSSQGQSPLAEEWHNQWLTDKARAEDIDFQCPSCHELEQGGAKRKELHPYFYLGREFPCWISQSSSWGFVKGHLSLKCVPSPPLFLSSSAQEWKFKFSQWSTRIKKLGEKLGVYAFKRKIIFITVHSEVTRGDLFAGKGESGEDVAMEVGEFMKCLFASPLQNMVYGSTLFMLTCGPVVSFKQSLAVLKQSITQLWPEYMVAFTAKDFLNVVIKIFIMSYGIKVLIEGHALENIIHDLLDVSLELWMHTDVLMVPQPSAPMGHISIHGVPEMWCHPSMGMIKAGPSSTEWLSPEDSSVHVPQPLLVEYDMLHGNPTSGWLKYTVCAAVPL